MLQYEKLDRPICQYCYNPGMRTIEQGHRGAAPKRNKESEIHVGKFKKLKAMLQKRLKTDKNNWCGLGHAV